jgi:hypothetical protein
MIETANVFEPSLVSNTKKEYNNRGFSFNEVLGTLKSNRKPGNRSIIYNELDRMGGKVVEAYIRVDLLSYIYLEGFMKM